jgi:hypothetical protein
VLGVTSDRVGGRAVVVVRMTMAPDIPGFWGLVLFPAAMLLVLWGVIHREGAVPAQTVRCPVQRVHAAGASLAVNTTDLQRKLPEPHLPLVEHGCPYCDGLL